MVAERGYDPWQASAAATHVRAPDATHGGTSFSLMGHSSTSFYGRNFDVSGSFSTWSARTGRDTWGGWSGWNWQDDAGSSRGSYGSWTTPEQGAEAAWTRGSPNAIRSFNPLGGGPSVAGQPSPSMENFFLTTAAKQATSGTFGPTGALPALSVGQGTSAGATPTLLGANNFASIGSAMMRTKAGLRPRIAPAGQVRQALDERTRRRDPIPWGEEPIRVSWDHPGRKVHSQGTNEIAVPMWDGLDPSKWPDVRTEILRWVTLTGTPIEVQGETLVATMTERAKLALKVYEPGDLLHNDGVEEVLGTLDEYFHEEADANPFDWDEASREPQKGPGWTLLSDTSPSGSSSGNSPAPPMGTGLACNRPAAFSSSTPGRSATLSIPKCSRKSSVVTHVSGRPGIRRLPLGLIQPASSNRSSVPRLRPTPLISSTSARVTGW